MGNDIEKVGEGPQYKWRFFDHPKRDIRVYEIVRSDCDKPWTIILFDYSKVGDEQLFSDIFYSVKWDEKRGDDGKVSYDIKFLINLWVELGLDKKYGSLAPRHIVYDDSRMPSVYRTPAVDVITQKFGEIEFIYNKV